jgi:carbonic anhydrase
LFNQLSSEDNPDLKNIVDALSNVTKPSPEAKSTMIGSRSLDWADKVLSSGRYKSYPGSFTSTPCNEVVIYIVMNEKVSISSEMVSKYIHIHLKNNNKLFQFRSPNFAV